MAAAAHAVRKRKDREKAERVQRAKSVFEQYDIDKSNFIDKNEVTFALRDLGIEISSEQASRFMRRFGSSERLSEPEFYRLIGAIQRHLDRRALLNDGIHSSAGVLAKYMHMLSPTRLPRWPYHERAAHVFANKYVQWFVAFLICFNFAVNCWEKEIDPFPSEMQQHADRWKAFDLWFNVAFTIELLLNIWACGGPYKKFWYSGWNVFDFLVVSIGIVFLLEILQPGHPLSNLKMMRAFRVFRLFKRVKSLNKVIMALVHAIPGVANAFVVMIICMMIYAILAVEYFSPLGQSFGDTKDVPYGTYVTFGDRIVGIEQRHVIDAVTDRGFVYGWEYYGTFSRALFTLFQVMTGEGWAEDVARPLMFGLYRDSVMVSIFFVSFILLTNVVLTNVVVAVLLDKFDSDEQDHAPQEHDAPPSAAPPKKLHSPKGKTQPKGPGRRLSEQEVSELFGVGAGEYEATELPALGIVPEDAPLPMGSQRGHSGSESKPGRFAPAPAARPHPRMPTPRSLPPPVDAYPVDDGMLDGDDFTGFVTLGDLDRKLNILCDAVAKIQVGLEEVRGVAAPRPRGRLFEDLNA